MKTCYLCVTIYKCADGTIIQGGYTTYSEPPWSLSAKFGAEYCAIVLQETRDSYQEALDGVQGAVQYLANPKFTGHAFPWQDINVWINGTHEARLAVSDKVQAEIQTHGGLCK